MRKSGLHKQIASIFDGGPQNGTLPSAAAPSAESSSAPSVLRRLYGGLEEDAAGSVPVESSPGAADVSEACETALKTTAGPAAAIEPEGSLRETVLQHKPVPPETAEGRPLPLPRIKIHPKVRQKRVSLSRQIQKKLFGESGADPHQKKMAVLACGLAVVFGVVLFFSLGGVGGSPLPSSAKETKTDETLHPFASGPVWAMPEALPEILRDPMKPETAKVTPAERPDEANRQFVVKGIVFSQHHSSALINDQIIREGQEFDGIRVVRITKTAVEFEADGRRWTQPVRP
jgi:hypothetical protein